MKRGISVARRISRVPIVGNALVQSYRSAVAANFVRASVVDSVRRASRWWLRSREYTNFTYPISPMSRDYLAAAAALALNRSLSEVLEKFDEIESDRHLSAHVQAAARQAEDGHLVDPVVYLGRRVVWYAAVRLLRPKLVVETGVDKGLGACVITAALERNARNGSVGTYLGTDINPAAGFLLSGPYAAHGRVLYGDSIDSIRRIEGTIDLFINDSDHSAEYEMREYEEVAPKLAPGALILGDNCDVTDALLRFSDARGRRFFYVGEQSVDHIYPGGGVGFSLPAPLRPH